jgi:hypothetical protein
LKSPKIFVGAGGKIILVGHLFSKGGKVFTLMVQPTGPKFFLNKKDPNSDHFYCGINLVLHIGIYLFILIENQVITKGKWHEKYF